MRNLFTFLLTVVSGIAILGNVHAADEPLPPEVRKLIGMKIQTEKVIREGKYIPNFIRFGSGMLNRQIGDETPRAELVYEEGIVANKWPLFIVSAMHADGVLEILDAQPLPEKLINWRYVNGKIEWLEHSDRLIFSTYCLYAKGDGRIIFGLEDPKVERDGMSTRIERAWEVNPQSGHIRSIPTQSVTCAILGE